MSRGIERSKRHTALDPRWPQRRVVSMPRETRPLFVAGAGFWPRDAADWGLLKFLVALDLALIAFLAYSIFTR